MGYHIRPGGGFLYDNASGDIIGYRDPDGSDKFFATLGEQNEFLVTQLFRGNLVVPKTAGKGIQCDPASPAFTWRDLEGRIQPKSSGVGSPTWKTWRGSIKGWAFVAGDIDDLVYHMPHDWVFGSDLDIHVHWTHNGTNISGSLTMDYTWTYQKGHNQGVYPAEKVLTQSIADLTLAARPQYGSFIDEIPLSSATPGADKIDTAALEVDGLIKISAKATTIPTVTGGDLFIDYIDIHYLSTNVGTKQKAPDFYS